MAIQVGFEIDVAGFKRGIDQVRSASATLQTGIGTAIKGAAAAFAAGSAVIVAAAHGMYDAMSQGGELVDLSERTGLAIDKLMELQFAFDQAGIGAAEVGPLVNKVQNAIADAAAGSAAGQKVFADLGLSLEELGTMDATAQMEAIGQAIAGIEDPIRRTQASMDIFGKSGGKMLALFAAGGSAEAKDALGKQAEVMAKNAAYFDSITDKLGTAAIKIRGLFIGMAAELVPDLLDAANRLNALDFTDIGKSVGSAVATIVDLFTSGMISDAFYIGLKIAIMKMINLFVQTFVNAVAIIETPLVALFAFIVSALEDPLKMAFNKAGAVLLEAAGKTLEMIGAGLQKFSSTRELGKSVTQTGLDTQWKAIDMETAAENIQGNMGGFSGIMEKAKSDAIEIVGMMFEETQGIDLFSDKTKAELEDLKTIWQQSQSSAQSAKDKLAPAEPRKGTGDGLTVVPPAGRGQSFEAITSSMARIGGGGLTAGMSFTVSPMVDQQKVTNGLLKQQNELMLRQGPTSGVMLA